MSLCKCGNRMEHLKQIQIEASGGPGKHRLVFTHQRFINQVLNWFSIRQDIVLYLRRLNCFITLFFWFFKMDYRQQ